MITEQYLLRLRRVDHAIVLRRSRRRRIPERNSGIRGFSGACRYDGLPSLAFVFHERYRNGYRFDCRGLGEWHGRAAWLVDFQQRPDRKSRIRGYDVQGTLYPVSLKGRAWIAADSFDVMRMEADTMKPVPQINLRDEHQTIEYAPVHFRTGDTELWLPASADLYFDFPHHRYHRVHSFDSYLLFSVSVSQKIGTPEQVAQK